MFAWQENKEHSLNVVGVIAQPVLQSMVNSLILSLHCSKNLKSARIMGQITINLKPQKKGCEFCNLAYHSPDHTATYAAENVFADNVEIALNFRCT